MLHNSETLSAEKLNENQNQLQQYLRPLFGDEERCTKFLFAAKSDTERLQVITVPCHHATDVLQAHKRIETLISLLTLFQQELGSNLTVRTKQY